MHTRLWRTARMGATLAVAAGLAWTSPSSAESVTATLEWATRVPLGVPVSGVVQEVAVRRGQRVKRGEVLLRLDRRIFESQVTEALAELQALEPELAEARREHERAQDLYERTLLADHELQLARNAELRLEAHQRRARAVLARYRVHLENSALRAPFDGIVVALPAVPGQAVSNRDQIMPLVVLAASGELRARTLVSSERAASLERDQDVQVVWGTTRYPGVIRHVSEEPLPDRPGAPVYTVDVHFVPGDETPLRVGGEVTLELP